MTIFNRDEGNSAVDSWNVGSFCLYEPLKSTGICGRGVNFRRRPDVDVTMPLKLLNLCLGSPSPLELWSSNPYFCRVSPPDSTNALK